MKLRSSHRWERRRLDSPVTSGANSARADRSRRTLSGKRSAHRLGAAVSMGVPSFYAWVKKRYPLMVEHVHHTCSDSPDGQAGANSVS